MFKELIAEVALERIRQDKQWGIQDHTPLKWLCILGEEYGEACKSHLEGAYGSYRKELVQVAAVALAAIDCWDRSQSMDEKASEEAVAKGKR